LLLKQNRQLAELAIRDGCEDNRVRHGLDSEFAFNFLPRNSAYLASLL
jgi:hypothetical protein